MEKAMPKKFRNKNTALKPLNLSRQLKTLNDIHRLEEGSADSDETHVQMQIKLRHFLLLSK